MKDYSGNQQKGQQWLKGQVSGLVCQEQSMSRQLPLFDSSRVIRPWCCSCEPEQQHTPRCKGLGGSSEHRRLRRLEEKGGSIIITMIIVILGGLDDCDKMVGQNTGAAAAAGASALGLGILT